MKKKWIGLLFIISLLVFVMSMTYLLVVNQARQGLILEQRQEIEDLHLSLGQAEAAIDTLSEAIEKANSINEGKNRTIEDLDIALKEYAFRENSRFIYQCHVIDLTMTEDQMMETFGEPKSVETRVMGNLPNDIWYLEGMYKKTCYYDDLIFYYLGDENGENYEIIEVCTLSQEISLESQLKVGNPREDLLLMHPNLIRDTWSKERDGYLLADRCGSQAVYFEIKQDKISGIFIFTLFH